MKTRIYLCAALALACLAACRQPESIAPETKTVTFHASMGDDTKTQLKGDGSVLWSPGDAIHIFFSRSGNSRFETAITSPAASADFTGDITGLTDMTAGVSVLAVYPYSEEQVFDGNTVTFTLPAVQQAVAGSFDKGLFLSMARSTSFKLNFFNVCGGVRFSVNRTGIRKVHFQGNDGEVLAGSFKAKFDNSGKPSVQSVTDPVTEIVVEAPGGGSFTPGQWYYIVTLPATLSKGYTLTFEGDSPMGSRIGADPVTIRRSVWGELKEADGLKLSTDSISFPSESGSTTINVFAAGDWTASSGASWCTVSPSSGSGSMEVTVSVSRNEAASPRNATVVFEMADHSQSRKLAVSQKRDVNVDWSRPFSHSSLVMDFTGDWCPYCPRMTRGIDYYNTAYPGKLEVVCVHAGDVYESSVRGTLENQYGIDGYPSIVVDGRRKEVGGDPDDARMATTIRQHTKETESNYPVSSAIGFTSSFFGRDLSVDVAVYLRYAASYKLTVFLLEDGKVSGQKDADKGYQSNYQHNDILRMSLTDAKGDAITTTTDQEKVERHFEVSVPSSYVLGNLRVLVFVQRAYGSQPVLCDGNYGGYYVDNAVSGQAGSNVEPRQD